MKKSDYGGLDVEGKEFPPFEKMGERISHQFFAFFFFTLSLPGGGERDFPLG